ncbi:DUF2235 domain-containing protein, partial [Erwinia sp. P6884]
VHLVSSHEQRLCFPLDSIRRPDGKYPANSVEVVYPGMHSDLGGGYPPGDQGKANESENRSILLLSQIALHDMYASAFSSGAPLKVPKTALPQDISLDTWRTMPFDLGDEFDIDTPLINRFNAWRKLTLGLSSSSDHIPPEQAAKYDPPRAPVSLEKALEDQMGWITAWRINRYAGGTYKTQRFYVDSAANGLDKDSDPLVRKQSEKDWKEAQKKVDDARQDMKAKHNPEDGFLMLPPGPKDFDAALG